MVTEYKWMMESFRVTDTDSTVHYHGLKISQRVTKQGIRPIGLERPIGRHRPCGIGNTRNRVPRSNLARFSHINDRGTSRHVRRNRLSVHRP